MIFLLYANEDGGGDGPVSLQPLPRCKPDKSPEKIIRKKTRKVLVFRKNFIPLHPQSGINISFTSVFR